jgi:hypothetical protein
VYYLLGRVPGSQEVRIPAMRNPAFQPQPARLMEEIGIPRALASELLLKRVFLEGTTNLSGLINSTKLG